MDKNEKVLTKIWQKYQKCKDYIDKKGLVFETNKNWNFYVGNQWEGCETGGEVLPVLNFIESVIKYKTSVISQNSMIANYSDMDEGENSVEICEKLNKLFAEALEKSKFTTYMWDMIEAAAVQGDSYAFWGENDPKLPPQILPNTSILLGDENITDIQKQPYILIVERLSVKAVQRIAKENGITGEDYEMITADDNKELTIVNREEVEDKVTSILYMTKNDDGIVEFARSTKSVIYEPQRPLQSQDMYGEYTGTGLMSYPIVPFIWKKRPNTARGVSEVASMIPNQIEVNKTIARRSMTVKLTAFPRIAYDASAVQNPEDIDKCGVAIEVNGGAQSVNQMISYLNATNISSDAEKLQNDLITMTRELSGAGDYATGNVNPEQASGQAILAVRDQAQIPLNKQIAQYQQFVEDTALLFFDMWIAFNPNGLQAKDMIIPIEDIESIKPSVRVDVSQDNAWSKLAEQQWVDAIFQQGKITFEEYVELCNSNAVPKGKLMQILKKRQMMQQQMPQMQTTQDQSLQQVEPIITQEEPIAATGDYYDRLEI